MFKPISIVILLVSTAGVFGPAMAGRIESVDFDALKTPVYAVEGDAFVRHNGDRYCNRPLYCNQITAAAFGGDKPYVMVGAGKNVLGNLMIALVVDGKGKWLQDASDITSKYRPGRMEWIVTDSSWGGTAIDMDVVPAAEGAGMAVHLRVTNVSQGEQIIWASGGGVRTKGSVLNDWDMTIPHTVYSITRGFVPTDCAGNLDAVNGDAWMLQASASAPIGAGQCSSPSSPILADADDWKDPVALRRGSGSSRPIVCGAIPLSGPADIYWSMKEAGAQRRSAMEEFTSGMKRAASIENQVVVETPDPWLNAAVGASSSAIDGVFRNGMFTHAGMRWSVPLLGWRTMFGGTVYGWHDRVKTESQLCIAKQITDSDKTAPHADPNTLLSSQSPDSRFFGKGRINLYQPYHYDMQSQFFDQVQYAWRWTGDPDLEKLLVPSLDLHCQYIKDCFDPNDLGIYESYANTWPTDDQWYNGGGTSEETAYAYRAEQTTLQLARRAGDAHEVQLHSAAVAKIRKAFFDLLWSRASGHPGAYREQGGLHRLHENCWLYSIFCPIDADLLDAEQSAQALNYTETSLQRVQLPYGGEQCWPSNWVPSIWSVREMWPGDNYHLALAYFQTGLAEQGWALLRGTFPQHMLFGTVPADMGAPAGATDFNDCNSMFARAVVEGLFGYVPDYPDGTVRIRPQFPADWHHASIKTPDVSIDWSRTGVDTHCRVHLTKSADLEIDLPVITSGVEAVTVNDKAAKWEVAPGFSRSIVKVKLATAAMADVAVTCRDELELSPPIQLNATTGQPVTIEPSGASVIDFHNPQGVLAQPKIERGTLRGIATANASDHVVFVLTRVGSVTQWRIVRLHIADVQAEADRIAKTQVNIPPKVCWETVDMRPVFNGDIRAIYHQKYLSPRLNTCSLRLATDGYSTWQMVLSKSNKPPDIDLTNIPKLSDGTGNIRATGGVPFTLPASENNIAFTSLWNNWPKRVDVPVNKSGDVVWFLVCGSTNPMEVQLPNAEIQMRYADGIIETLPLVPPFNFWTLCPMNGIDYDYSRDAFALPKTAPKTVQLGNNCRAILLSYRLRPGAVLQSVTLQSLSQQVVIGLMGMTIMHGNLAKN